MPVAMHVDVENDSANKRLILRKSIGALSEQIAETVQVP